jgi:FkbM family methyltransferase
MTMSQSSSEESCNDAPTELYERVLEQWHVGDWDSLAQTSQETLEQEPRRSKVALLVAAAHLQRGSNAEARLFVTLARQWGCDCKLVYRVLIASVHNSLGRVELARGQDDAALHHFRTSIATAQPHADVDALAHARAIRQSAQLGLLPLAAQLLDAEISVVKPHPVGQARRISILESQMSLLRHELSLAQQRQQLYSPADILHDEGHRPDAAGSPSPRWLTKLQRKAVSQLGQDIWVLERTGFKTGGFFVEFGATDGVLLSNTWLLEKQFGWHGICAEPNPMFFAKLRQNRSCRVSAQYIGAATGEAIEFVLSEEFGGDAKHVYDDHNAGLRQPYLQGGHVTTLESISLDDFLEQHNAPQGIDYISIDTEGSEYEILQHFPFDKWKVKLFTIEHNFTAQRALIRELLTKHGYICREAKWEDWYELSESGEPDLPGNDVAVSASAAANASDAGREATSGSARRVEIRFLTFADSRLAHSTERFVDQASALSVFDACHRLDEQDLSWDFRSRHSDILNRETRGFGYWIWKPKVILDAFEDMRDGDSLLYADAGFHLNPNGVSRLKEYVSELHETDDGILLFKYFPLPQIVSLNGNREYMNWRNHQWCKGDLARHFELADDQAFLDDYSVCAGALLLKKSKASMDIVSEWLATMESDYHLIDDSPSVHPNPAGFIEHRHDQAVLNCIAYCKSLPSISAYETDLPRDDRGLKNWEFLSAFPLHARRDTR